MLRNDNSKKQGSGGGALTLISTGASLTIQLLLKTDTPACERRYRDPSGLTFFIRGSCGQCVTVARNKLGTSSEGGNSFDLATLVSGGGAGGLYVDEARRARSHPHARTQFASPRLSILTASAG